MACHQCGIMESFTQQEEKKCSVQKSMTNCLYTAQGIFICQKPSDEKGVVSNKEMAQRVFEMKNGAQYAANSLQS